jgi:hypothetical protein
MGAAGAPPPAPPPPRRRLVPPRADRRAARRPPGTHAAGTTDPRTLTAPSGRLAAQVQTYACLYTSHVTNLAYIAPDARLRVYR